MPRLVVEAKHLDQIREHGGMPRLRDEDALEAALARPRQKWSLAPDSDLALLAAVYAFGIAGAHPFNDGNKRTAFLTLAAFLGLNGKDLAATEREVVQVMVALAAGTLTEPALATWVRGRLTKLKR